MQSVLLSVVSIGIAPKSVCSMKHFFFSRAFPLYFLPSVSQS